jgi:putative tricarboxylic transport membrane protein
VQILTMLLHGFSISILPTNLAACTIGVLLGTLVGVLPGIDTISAIALLLPFSYGMDTTAALILFAGIYYGSKYGGSTTAILLNIPGETSSVVTCIDGYPMTKKGRGGAALTISAIGSFVAGTIGIIGLTLFAPPLAQMALHFGPPEYFSLALVGLLFLTKLTGTSMLKSTLMATMGIMLSTIGVDSLFGISRFTGGFSELDRGFDLSILAMGIFGVGELFVVMTQHNPPPQIPSLTFRDLYPTKEELGRSIAPILRGSITGFLTGLLPCPAGTISSFTSYALEKRCSNKPAEFGHGAIEGIAGPESANNAAVSATLIPLLTLGLPFCGGTAILLCGFMLHGIIPGPALITQQPDLFWGLIASMYVGNVMLLIINFPLIGIFINLLKIPMNLLMPIVTVLTLTGAYAINNSIFDLLWILFFGIIGFFLKRTELEPAPLIIGMVIGPELERGLLQSLIISNGSLSKLISRPISATILSFGLIFLAYQGIGWLQSTYKKRGMIQ